MTPAQEEACRAISTAVDEIPGTVEFRITIVRSDPRGTFLVLRTEADERELTRQGPFTEPEALEICAAFDEKVGLAAAIGTGAIRPTGLTRLDLDGMGCHECAKKAKVIDIGTGAEHKHEAAFVLHARCHVSSPTVAYYHADGTLDVHCKRCNQFVDCIAIAPVDVERLAPKLKCDDASCDKPPEEHFLVLTAHGKEVGGKRSKQGVFVSYSHGLITVMCSHCSRVVETLHVREAAS